MAIRFRTHYNEPGYEKIYNTSDVELVEKAHVPHRAQIESIMRAGSNLAMARKAMYNEGYYDQFVEENIDWSLYDPTRDSSFDYFEANRLAKELDENAADNGSVSNVTEESGTEVPSEEPASEEPVEG